MKMGTKSLLFGVHQFLWHPFTVWLAWIKLYRRLPGFRESVCIFVHDWGYWGCGSMNSGCGAVHPVYAAYLVYPWFGEKWAEFCLFHSRHFAKARGKDPSLLCWADKGSITFDPWWLYLPRAWASGELEEYRREADHVGLLPKEYSHRSWHRWIVGKFNELAEAKRGDAIPYMNEEST